jgi:energy-coupling factor transport system permease protein
MSEAVQRSLIGRVNPSAKLILHLLCMLVLIFVHTPQTSLYLLAIPVLLILFLSGVSWKKFFLRISPFFLLFLSTLWILAAYGKGTTVVWEWGWIHITKEGLTNGLNIGLRMLSFVTYGLLFSMTTDITLLVFSFMQQLKVPPKIAYALLAGFRFLPTFREEFAQIKAAHRVRGVARVPGIRGRVEAIKRYTIPLLAQGIRKAERVAVALEARGFDGSWNRTFYHQMKLGSMDVIYLLLLIGLHTLIWAVLR